MVGRLLLAAGCRKRSLREQFLAKRRVSRVAGDGLHDLLQVERARVHRVVDARIGDIAVHVEALSEAHRACRGKALGRRRSHEACGVEGNGRLLLARALLDGEHLRACRPFDGGHGGRRLHLVLETRRSVGRLEGKRALAWCGAGLLGGVEGALDHPVVLGDKCQTLALARHDEGERRRLHAARRAHVAVARELHEGEVAREHRAPDKVDILARCAGGRQIDVKLHEVGERVGDFLLREGGVAGARDGGGGVHFLDARERIGADELALAVEVRRDHDGVRLLGEVLQAADDFLFLRKLLDRRVDQVRQRVHLPPFKLHAVFGEGLFLLERGLGQACGHVGGHGLALDGHALPAAALLIYQVGGEVGL